MPRSCRFLLLMLCLLWVGRVGAQPFRVLGSVKDTSIGQPIWRASVSLISAKDSILSTFTRTDTTGAFHLQTDSAGKYFLLVSYPGYGDFLDLIQVNGSTVVPPIALTSRSHLLQEFVFTKRAAAIVLKGDTTEFAADSFKVENGANVETLLKRLPGLQVDKDGNITAQGEKVQKVLVDGEEFFSDDPAVVTQNLQAAVVDKVQVYDKKSDQAIFTGIDDGDLTKTINLKLKEDKKKGLFGKVAAGAGPSFSADQKDGFYDGQAMVNFFKGKQQISGFGILSNTGRSGLSWGDRDKFGGGNNNVFYDEESGTKVSFASNDDDDLSGGWDGQYSGEGRPKVATGGLHYANKWADNKQHVSANYRYADLNVDAQGSTITQYILPDSQYVRDDERSTANTGERHGGNALYEWTIDSTSNLKFQADASFTDRHSNGSYSSETRGASGGLINTGSRHSSSHTSTQRINANLGYRKKFAKKGRNMSAQLGLSSQTNDGLGFLESVNTYYSGSTGTDSINQRKTNNGNNLNLDAQLSYTEPLAKNNFLSFRYGAQMANSLSERYSFNRAGADWSNDFDSLNSSAYRYDVLTQNAALSYRYVNDKVNLSIGGEVFHTDWEQEDQIRPDSDRHRSYVNFAPKASFRYQFSRWSRFVMNYSGSTNQPSMDQLQPLRQNTDPLNVAIGNPDLRQEFQNNVYAQYNSYRPISGRFSYFGGSFNFTKDAISRAENFDAEGRRTYQYVNLNGNWGATIWGGYYFKWKPLALSLGLSGTTDLRHSKAIVNNATNTTQSNSYRLNFRVSRDWKKDDKEVFSFEVEPGFTWNDYHASISTALGPYWTANISGNIFARLPWKLELRSEAWYDLREQTEVFTQNNNVLRWDASLGRKFLKGGALELRATVNDILNQNLGYSRDAEVGSISENRYTTIRRHGLLTLIYHFSGGAGKGQKDEDED